MKVPEKNMGNQREVVKGIKAMKDKRYERNNSRFNIDWPFAQLSSIP
jgi:hypothetical protein